MGYNEADDKADFARLKETLGQNAPETFQDYQNLKYNSGDWAAYSSYAGTVESGNLTPMADFEIYQQNSAKIDHTLVGVQAANGVTITGKSDLFVANTIGSVARRQSGVDVQSVRYVVTHPTQISPIKNTSSGRVQWLTSERVAVLVNLDTGDLISVESKPRGNGRRWSK